MFHQENAAAEHQVTTPWKFLNSGLHVGRLWAMRLFYAETMEFASLAYYASDQERRTCYKVIYILYYILYVLYYVL